MKTNQEYKKSLENYLAPFVVNNVKTVEEFVKVYYKPSLTTDTHFLKFALEHHIDECSEYGITDISSADSITGKKVAFKLNTRSN